MNFKIAVLRGDGIGPEIVDEALRILQAVGRRFKHEFQFVEAYAGGEAWERFGEHLPQTTLDACRSSDAILKGPFGGPTAEMHHPKWSGVETTAILGLRHAFDLFMNLRPVVVYPEIVALSPLRPEIVEAFQRNAGQLPKSTIVQLMIRKPRIEILRMLMIRLRRSERFKIAGQALGRMRRSNRVAVVAETLPPSLRCRSR